MDEINSASSALDVQAAWDNRYAAADQLWSGQPNGQLVTETRGLRPARALDVGCGEGADALWLAAQGWAVTALDVSRLALDRAADQAERAGVQVTWLHSGLVDAELPPASFAEFALLRAVAAGGTLLVVHHVPPSKEEAHAHGFDPDDYVSPALVAAVLDDNWEVEVDEVRARHVTTGAGSGHSHDIVLKARRLA
jgi:SAM-dependent methyltransferase